MKSVKRVVKKFLISDINEKIIVEETTRKDVLGYIDEYLGNIEYGIAVSDFSIKILYKDGSSDSVAGNDYDNHKIKRINILSAVIDNPCTSIVFGNYEVNKYGVVNPSAYMSIDSNIKECTE